MYSTTLYHGSTWLHNTLPSLYLILPCLYLCLYYTVSTIALLDSTRICYTLPCLYYTVSTMALLDIILFCTLYHGSIWIYMTLLHSTAFFHGSTWPSKLPSLCIQSWVYLILPYHILSWVYLHFTLATIHSTLAVLGSTLFFYILYGCTWFYILYSTTLYHSSSWLYITLLYSTMAVLQSATLSHASPLLQSIMVQLDSTSLTTLSWLNRNKPFFNANSISHNSVITITYYHME